MEEESVFRFEKQLVRDQTERAVNLATEQFDSLIKSYGAFHLAFFGLIVIELLLFVIFFTWLLEASVVALSLAGIVLTLFTYFTLRLYYQTRKPILLTGIRNDCVESCKELLGYQKGVPEHHMALATACVRYASALQGREYGYYQPPAWLKAAGPYLERFSCWFHDEDLLQMRELLVLSAVGEYIQLVQQEPTSLEMHTALANGYVTLSSLYAGQVRLQPKFRTAAQCAIQEFKILNEYAPNDPWIHTQLAYSYRDLHMPDEEIREYETILKLRPNDPETLFRLGRLYFQQGLNAKGLRIYEALRGVNSQRAAELITYYGDTKPQG